MLQEIAIVLIGLLVAAYVARGIYRLFFSKDKAANGCGCGCGNCPKRQCGIPDHPNSPKKKV